MQRLKNGIKKIVVNAKEFLKTLKRTVIATEDAKRTVLKGAHVLVGQDFLIIEVLMRLA